METEFKNAAGKSAGEVLRDLAELACTPFPIGKDERTFDLCSLTPELHMQGQLAYALLREAETQGWEPMRAAGFAKQALAAAPNAATVDAILTAFRTRDPNKLAAMERLYGNRFSMPSDGYWATVLALGIDADAIPAVMQYLRAFCVVLTEFAYMGGANPEKTYAWGYFESFERILSDLMRKPDPAPLPLKVRAIGGTAGKRTGNGYALSLGVDVENPNSDRMAREVEIDITLKDKNGAPVAVLRDRISSIDPATVYHFGGLKQIRGAAVASISATAKAGSFLKLETPVMKHIRLANVRRRVENGETTVTADLASNYDKSLSAVAVSLQLLSPDNKILGGATEWCFDGIAPNEPRTLEIKIPVAVQNSQKLVYSVDFDALELI